MTIFGGYLILALIVLILKLARYVQRLMPRRYAQRQAGGHRAIRVPYTPAVLRPPLRALAGSQARSSYSVLFTHSTLWTPARVQPRG